jgi:ThiF family
MVPDPRIEFLAEAAPQAVASDLAHRLDSTHIHVRATAAQPALLLSLVNLLTRLMPNITVDAPPAHVTVPVFGTGPLDDLARGTVRRARLATPTPANRTLIVDLGTNVPGADLYVMSGPWTVWLANTPLAASPGTGPAVVAASALAAAEAFRRVVPELAGVRLGDEPFVWNLLDYRCAPAPTDPTPSPVEAVCFGVGSVGSSLVYALLLAGAAGQLTVVDPDRLSERNRLRYPLWLDSACRPKVRWLQEVSVGTRLSVLGHQQPAAAFIRDLPTAPNLVVAAVDNVAARRDITDALAHTALNAGVDGLRFHVSRHRFGDNHACLYCAYVDTEAALDEPAVYHQLTGLSLLRVHELLAGAPLTRHDLAHMVTTGRLPPGTDTDQLEGGRIQDVVRVRLYGQARVQLGDVRLAVSAPFLAALAGSILAAELQKERGAAANFQLDRRVDVDCSGFPVGFTSQPPRDRSGRCLCHDPFRLEAYWRCWRP